MIQLIDLFVKSRIEKVLNYLGKNPDLIDNYFKYASKETNESIKKFISNFEIQVRSSYPRDELYLPAIIVLVESEQEVPYGLGGGIDENYIGKDENYLHWDIEEDHPIQENIQMQTSIRCEIWSDNGVTTSFLYAITKYALLSTRKDFENENIILSSLHGGDLEPVPEYFNHFVYRRALNIECEYESSYFRYDEFAGKMDSQFSIGTNANDVFINGKGANGDREEDNNKQG